MRFLLLLTILLFAALPAAQGQTLFSETWDDGLAASRWSSPIGVQENLGIAFDGMADYAFNYSTLSIPSAPSSAGGTTLGLFLETNRTDQSIGDEGESIGVLPVGLTLPDTNYIITADLYLYGNGDTSSATEYATLGTHHQGTSNLPHRFGINSGDGLAWQLNTDGASSSDLIRYESLVGETSLGGWEAIPQGSIPHVPTGDATPIGIMNRWVTLLISSLGGQVEFAVNGFVIDSYDNANATYSGGTLLLSQSDPFNSVNLDNAFGHSNGAVFDNVTVAAVGLPGDFNHDGQVDAADYTVWRDTIKTPSTYALWVANHGAGTTSTSIPEPSTWLLATLSFLFLLHGPRGHG